MSDNSIVEQLIKELSLSISRHNIDSYYQFVEKWNRAFPQTTKESRKMVREVSPKLGISPTTVYSILAVAKKYPKRRYLLFRKKMQQSERILWWARIRTMTQCCGDDTKLLKQAEDLLLMKTYTDKEWCSVCHELAGKPIKQHRNSKAKQVVQDSVKTATKLKPAATQTISEIIDTIRGVTSKLQYFSNSIISDRLQSDTIKPFMSKLDDVIDGLNVTHSRLMESCECGDIVKDGEMEMHREHYDRYVEVRRRKEQSEKKQSPSVV